MTAEIAVMNREAIALAADSAVTLGDADGRPNKVFTSANKIFTASKYEPIAVMIYGNAMLMGVPWEPVIKLYRDGLGNKHFSTVEEYAQDLIRFLSDHRQLFPADRGELFFKRHLGAYYHLIVRGVRKAAGIGPDDPLPPLSPDEWAKYLAPILQRHIAAWKKADFLPNASASDLKPARAKYRKVIGEVMDAVFHGMSLSPAVRRTLLTLGTSALVKCPSDFRWESLTGLVVAGFGRDELFPALRAFSVFGVFNDRLNQRLEDKVGIGFGNEASICPFAQSDMVYTFMEGVDQSYQSEVERATARILREFPAQVIDKSTCLNDSQKHQLKLRLESEIGGVIADYASKLADFRYRNSSRDIIDLVSVLPKDELATLAESMVNLTSLRRKVSKGTETVGGPIDVALISKAEGLIWIKRKHYFDPSLNHQFFANYYRGRREAQP